MFLEVRLDRWKRSPGVERCPLRYHSVSIPSLLTHCSVLTARPHSEADSAGSVLFTQIFVPQNRATKSTNLPGPGDTHLPAVHEMSPLPLEQGPIGAQDDPQGAGAHGTRPSGGPASLGLLQRQRRAFFFSQSLVELHMVEIKGVAGCMVLLYFRALLLIRKQDQRQY